MVDVHSMPQEDSDYYNDNYNDYYYDGVTYSLLNGTNGNATDQGGSI